MRHELEALTECQWLRREISDVSRPAVTEYTTAAEAGLLVCGKQNNDYIRNNGPAFCSLVGQDSNPAAGVHAGLLESLIALIPLSEEAGPGGPAPAWRPAPQAPRKRRIKGLGVSHNRQNFGRTTLMMSATGKAVDAPDCMWRRYKAPLLSKNARIDRLG